MRDTGIGTLIADRDDRTVRAYIDLALVLERAWSRWTENQLVSQTNTTR